MDVLGVLAGEPDGSWAVDLPAEEVPAELPEPCLGINFARNGPPPPPPPTPLLFDPAPTHSPATRVASSLLHSPRALCGLIRVEHAVAVIFLLPRGQLAQACVLAWHGLSGVMALLAWS